MLIEKLPAEFFASISPFYNWLSANIPFFVKLTGETLTEPGKMDAPDH
jgi:hypothetical protein